MFVSISHLDLFFSLDTDTILTILMLKEHSIWFIDFTFFFYMLPLLNICVVSSISPLYIARLGTTLYSLPPSHPLWSFLAGFFGKCSQKQNEAYKEFSKQIALWRNSTSLLCLCVISDRTPWQSEKKKSGLTLLSGHRKGTWEFLAETS